MFYEAALGLVSFPLGLLTIPFRRSSAGVDCPSLGGDPVFGRCSTIVACLGTGSGTSRSEPRASTACCAPRTPLYVSKNGAPVMRKKLSAIGNSLGIVIEKPILELLDISRDTELEMKTDGQRLIIEPVRKGKKRRVEAALEHALVAHDESLRKLAR